MFQGVLTTASASLAIWKVSCCNVETSSYIFFCLFAAVAARHCLCTGRGKKFHSVLTQELRAVSMLFGPPPRCGGCRLTSLRTEKPGETPSPRQLQLRTQSTLPRKWRREEHRQLLRSDHRQPLRCPGQPTRFTEHVEFGHSVCRMACALTAEAERLTFADRMCSESAGGTKRKGCSGSDQPLSGRN